MSNKTTESGRGMLVVLSAPSGCGKTSIVERLLKRHPDWVRSISATTRKPRVDEKDAQDYFFYAKQDFEKKVHEEKMLPEGKVVEHPIALGPIAAILPRVAYKLHPE